MLALPFRHCVSQPPGFFLSRLFPTFIIFWNLRSSFLCSFSPKESAASRIISRFFKPHTTNTFRKRQPKNSCVETFKIWLQSRIKIKINIEREMIKHKVKFATKAVEKKYSLPQWVNIFLIFMQIVTVSL